MLDQIRFCLSGPAIGTRGHVMAFSFSLGKTGNVLCQVISKMLCVSLQEGVNQVLKRGITKSFHGNTSTNINLLEYWMIWSNHKVVT